MYPTPHNSCHFEGRITKDPKINTYNGNNNQPFKVAIFTMAVDRKMTREQKAAPNAVTADFPSFKASGGMADFIQNFGQVGRALAVDCHYEEYQTTDGAGQTQFRNIFVVDQVGFTVSDSKALQEQSNQNNQNNNNQNGGNGNYQAAPGGYNNAGGATPPAAGFNMYGDASGTPAGTPAAAPAPVPPTPPTGAQPGQPPFSNTGF